MITAETVSSIRTFDGGGLPVVSLYARVAPGPDGQREVRTRVSSLLDEIRPLAKDGIAEREWRMSLRGDIDRIKSAAGQERWPPAAIAIFACSGRGLYTEVPLPEHVPDRVIVDATPCARPMLAVLAEHPRSCVAVVNRATGRLCELYQDEVSELGQVKDPESRRPPIAAGRPDDRVSNKIDELAKRHYRRVAERLGKLLQTGDYDLLIIGGHGYEVPDFVQQLPRPVRDRVAGDVVDRSAFVDQRPARARRSRPGWAGWGSGRPVRPRQPARLVATTPGAAVPSRTSRVWIAPTVPCRQAPAQAYRGQPTHRNLLEYPRDQLLIAFLLIAGREAPRARDLGQRHQARRC